MDKSGPLHELYFERLVKPSFPISTYISKITGITNQMVSTSASIKVVLQEFKDTGCFWIEDKPKNAEVGKELGLDSILVAHEHNAGYKGEIPRLWKWKYIYKHIIGEA